ncbi:MAG: hypothetical protein KDD22_05485 [Bdellovibrionales bacterium]|nr:hypothetical protein [Bdellovibrionales bacterium]
MKERVLISGGFLFFVLLVPFFAWGQWAPSTYRKAKVLFAGQHVVNFRASLAEASRRRSSTGQVEALGSHLEERLTWAEILSDSSPDTLEIKDYLQEQGVDLEQEAASTEMRVHQKVYAFSPRAAYGLTDRWTLGFELPIVYRKTQVETKIHASEFRTDPGSQNSQAVKAAWTRESLGEKAKEALDRKIESANFRNPSGNAEDWQVGDISLWNKYEMYHSADSIFSLRQRLVLPTSAGPNPYEFIDSEAGDGQVDFGFDGLVDHWITKGLWATLSLGYTWQTPDRVRMRIPEVQSTPLASDLDYEVRRDLGDYWLSELILDYQISQSWKISPSYSYFMKTKDRYSGRSYSLERYQALSEGTEQKRQVLVLAAAYSGFDQSERFGVQKQVLTTFFISSLVSGANVTDSTMAGINVEWLF